MSPALASMGWPEAVAAAQARSPGRHGGRCARRDSRIASTARRRAALTSLGGINSDAACSSRSTLKSPIENGVSPSCPMALRSFAVSTGLPDARCRGCRVVAVTQLPRASDSSIARGSPRRPRRRTVSGSRFVASRGSSSVPLSLAPSRVRHTRSPTFASARRNSGPNCRVTSPLSISPVSEAPLWSIT